jgi:MYXO-CTERM domain-containing protein
MRRRLLALVLMVVASGAFAAPPAAWNSRSCFSCHSIPALSGRPADLQDWPTRLSGLNASNFQDRLRAQAANSATMPTLANDGDAANGPNDRAAILQYLLDVRDGRITDNLALGTVTIDAPTGSSGTVTITNERSRPMTYSAPTFSASSGFSITAESCGTRTVPASSSCTVTIQFLPQSPSTDTADRSATLSLTLSGTGGDPDPGLKSVSLSGTAQTSLEITAGPLPFTATRPNTSAPPQTVTVNNRLGSNLRLCLVNSGGGLAAPGDFNLVGRTYDIAPRCTTLTSPGTTVSQNVTFSPQADGPRFARLTVQRVSGAGSLLDPLRTVELQGNAGPFITLQGSGLTGGKTLFSGVSQDVDAGATAPTVVRLTNEGSTSLRFSSIAIPLVAGAASAEYVASGGCSAGLTLDVSTFCDLSVTFNPSASDPRLRTTQLQISFTDLAGTPGFQSPVKIDLLGQGTRGASLIVLNALGTEVATGSSEDFGNQNINVTLRRKITLRNIGSDESLAVSARAITPTSSGFDLVAPTVAGACPSIGSGFTLAAGDSCVAEVTFSPIATTPYAAILTLPSRPAGAVTPPINFVLNLSGEGVDGRPNLAWQRDDGSALALLEVPGVTSVGTPTPPQVNLRLANLGPGAAALRLLNVIGVDSSSFALEPSVGPGRCSFGDAAPVLGEGSTCSVVITFRPQTAGAKTGLLQLVSTGTTPAPLEIRAQASGPASTIALTAIPASLNLNEVRIGAQSAPATVTLANDGSASAVVTAIDASAGFAFEPGSCGALPFSIEPRSSCTLSIHFAPRSAGASSGSLRVQVNGVVAPVEVALQGTGTEAADISGGGCSISDGRSPADPTLWALVLLAAAVLFYRRRRRGSASHNGHPRRGFQ